MAPYIDTGSTTNLVSNYEDPYNDSMDYTNFPLRAEKENPGLAPKSMPKKTGWTKGKITVCVLVSLLLLLAAALVPVGLLVLKPMMNKKSSPSENTDAGNDSTPGNSTTVTSNPGTVTNGNNFPYNKLTSPGTHDPSPPVIPASAKGTVLDSTTWLDKTDFNLTYTNATVGGLSVMVNIHPEKG